MERVVTLSLPLPSIPNLVPRFLLLPHFSDNYDIKRFEPNSQRANLGNLNRHIHLYACKLCFRDLILRGTLPSPNRMVVVDGHTCNGFRTSHRSSSTDFYIGCNAHPPLDPSQTHKYIPLSLPSVPQPLHLSSVAKPTTPYLPICTLSEPAYSLSRSPPNPLPPLTGATLAIITLCAIAIPLYEVLVSRSFDILYLKCRGTLLDSNGVQSHFRSTHSMQVRGTKTPRSTSTLVAAGVASLIQIMYAWVLVTRAREELYTYIYP